MEFNALRFTQNGMDGYLIKIPSSRIQNSNLDVEKENTSGWR